MAVRVSLSTQAPVARNLYFFPYFSPIGLVVSKTHRLTTAVCREDRPSIRVSCMFTKGGYFQILLPGGFSKHTSAERAHAKTNKKVATSAPRLPSRTFSFV